MTSAEEVTKLLRAKNATPKSVDSVASDLLLRRIPVFLPNADQFVFDLLCDRMNDLTGKVFNNWKYSPELWLLWKRCWQKLGSTELNREMRAKSFANVRIIQVVLDALEKVYVDSQPRSEPAKDGVKKIYKEKNPKSNDLLVRLAEKGSPVLPEHRRLLGEMFACLTAFMKSGYISVDEISATALLLSYTKLLLLQFAQDDETDSWAALISTLYHIPRQSATYKPSKKAIARYYSEVLPFTLRLFTANAESLQELAHTLIHSAFCKVLFEGKNPSLVTQVKFHAEFVERLSDAEIELLFEQSLLHLAPNDVSHCETLYSGLTKNRLYALCTSLLSALSKLNRVMSPLFTQDIFHAQMNNKPVNWLLAAKLMSIDTTLALSNWESLVKAACTSELFASTATEIALGFVRAREYSKFLSNVYPYALSKSDAWDNELIFSTLSSHVNNLSGNQINNLVNELVDRKQLKSLLLIAYGLFSCSLIKQEAAKSAFTRSLIRDFKCSQLSFYVYCLYGDYVLEQEEFVYSQGQLNSYYDLCLVFRNVEMTGDMRGLEEKNLESVLGKLRQEEVLLFFNRWIVILENLPNLHGSLLTLFFSLPKELILGFLKTRATVIFELPHLLKSILSYIENHEVLGLVEILEIMPHVVIRKFFSDHVRVLCSKLKENPNDISSMKVLQYVMLHPTLSLEMETKADYLIDLAHSTNPEYLPLVINMVSNIWRAHLQALRTERSRVYTSDYIAKLLNNLSKPQNSDLELAKCVLVHERTRTLERADELLEKYIILVSKSNGYTFEKKIDSLTDVSFLTEITKKAVNEVIESAEPQKLSPVYITKLYDLVTQVYGPSHNVFLMTLFVALRKQLHENHHEDLINSLSAYFSRLPERVFKTAFCHVLLSFKDVPKDLLCPLLDLLIVMTSNLRKYTDDLNFDFFTASFLRINSHVRDCNSPKTLLRAMDCVAASFKQSLKASGQYPVELEIELCNTAAALLNDANDANAAYAEQIYLSLASIFTKLIVQQRHRFFSRYHLVVGAMTTFLEPLSGNGPLKGSYASADAFKRMLVSLCEPQVYSSTRDSTKLTSLATMFKDAFRRHAHILLCNFISIHLSAPFTGDTYDKVMSGIYSLCGLMTKNDFKLARQHLDSQGQTYLQTLYSDGKSTNKWVG